MNPSRDIGPTSIHGLTSTDILDAPPFADVAAYLVSALEGTVAIAGHNVRFDQQFLECEFLRRSYRLPECLSLCTMELAGGGKLSTCCGHYGITFDGDAHSALIDARATAHLLGSLLTDSPSITRELGCLPRIHWPVVPAPSTPPLTREASRHRQLQPPGYLQRLLESLPSETLPAEFDGAALAYTALLDWVIEDRQIDECEGDGLLETAKRWGMNRRQVQHVHQCYVDRLAMAAVADGVVSDAERRDLYLVCHLVGDTSTDLDAILNQAAAKLHEVGLDRATPPQVGESLVGKRVCFTGEMACTYCGRSITRDLAEQLATSAGLQVTDSVTKKLDVLVVADPHTQSGKAKKARQYGVRVLHEPVFWSAIGVTVQ